MIGKRKDAAANARKLAAKRDRGQLPSQQPARPKHPSHRAEDIAAGRAKANHGAGGGASLSCERCGEEVGHHENMQTHLEDTHLQSPYDTGKRTASGLPINEPHSGAVGPGV